METSRVTANGRIVIPVRLRRKLGIKRGTVVRFIEDGGNILLLPITKLYIGRICGMLKSDTSMTDALLEERRGFSTKPSIAY